MKFSSPLKELNAPKYAQRRRDVSATKRLSRPETLWRFQLVSLVCWMRPSCGLPSLASTLDPLRYRPPPIIIKFRD